MNAREVLAVIAAGLAGAALAFVVPATAIVVVAVASASFLCGTLAGRAYAHREVLRALEVLPPAQRMVARVLAEIPRRDDDL